MAKTIVKTSVKWDRTKIGDVERRSVEGLVRLGYDIASNARARAPYLTGALSNSIRVVQTSSSSLDVVAGGTFGGKRIDYAWIREQGPNRLASTEHYMENAAKQVMSGNYIQKYFGDITK